MPVDLSGLFAGLDGLVEKKESLARRMGVSGGQVVREAARDNVPIGDPTDGYDAPWKKGSTEPGALRDAIYLAYSEKRSDKDRFVYSVSWNTKKAFWGVFVEFGFIMEHLVLMNVGQNTFWTVKGAVRPNGPLRVNAKPFLAPALDQNLSRIFDAALNRGKEELPKLLAEIKK